MIAAHSNRAIGPIWYDTNPILGLTKVCNTQFTNHPFQPRMSFRKYCGHMVSHDYKPEGRFERMAYQEGLQNNNLMWMWMGCLTFKKRTWFFSSYPRQHHIYVLFSLWIHALRSASPFQMNWYTLTSDETKRAMCTSMIANTEVTVLSGLRHLKSLDWQTILKSHTIPCHERHYLYGSVNLSILLGDSMTWDRNTLSFVEMGEGGRCWRFWDGVRT